MNHSIGKHRALYGLLKSKGVYEYRHGIIEQFTDGVTADSRELSEMAITDLISQLRNTPDTKDTQVKYAGMQPMISKVYYLARQYGYTVSKKGKRVVDKKRLDSWMKKYSYLKKPFGNYTLEELPKLITQFEMVVSKFLDEL